MANEMEQLRLQASNGTFTFKVADSEARTAASNAQSAASAASSTAAAAKTTAEAAKATADGIIIPTALPNPKKLKFTGGVTAEYDGSGEVTITIPTGGESDDTGGDCNIQRIESESSNYVYLRDLASGLYVLYGYFRPFNGSGTRLVYDNVLASVAADDTGSHILTFDTVNSKINFVEILVDDKQTSGFYYNRTAISLLDLHGLIAKIGNMDGLSTTEKSTLVAAINEVEAKAGGYYNAKFFGAAGDGSTDDSTALNALVTRVNSEGGGTIYLPKGTYMLDSPVLWQSNVSLRGEGIGISVLKTRQAAGVGEGFAAIRGLTFSADDPCTNCTFEQFTIDGEEMQITEYTSWPKGINIHFMSNCVFRDIEIRNTCATGLGVDHLRNSVVDHVVCINCGRSWTGNGVEQNVGGAGIGIGSNCMEGESLIVQNCVADGCGNYGIFFEKQGYTYPGKPEGHVIANNVVRNGRNHGIVVKGDSNVVVSGNVVFGNANDGLAVLENNGFVTEHIMFSDNLVRGNGNGFRLESDGVCRDITLSGNVFNGNANGIVLNTDTTELSLIGNTIKNSTTAVTVQGIHADAVIRNNIVYKNTVGESVYGTFTGDTSQNDLYSASVDLSAYTRLEYIQSSGTQYINTGFTPDSNTRVVAKTSNDYALDVLNYAICGTRTASKVKEFDLRCSSQFYYGSSMVDTGVSHSGTVDFNKNTLRANDALVGTAPAEAFECEYPLYIFALNGAGTALSNTMAAMRLYYLNIFDDGTLVRALIPVRRKSDGAIGLADSLTGVFYENLGSGAFTGA